MIGWLVLIFDQLFWSVVVPPAVLLAWAVMRLCSSLCVQAGLMSESPVWLDTPFDLLAYCYLLAHGVHVWDEGLSGMAVSSPILLPGVRLFRGAVLMNHRCADATPRHATAHHATAPHPLPSPHIPGRSATS
jgi:hypothetical protein